MKNSHPKTFVLHCEEPWFSLIRQGIKPVEGRKKSPKYEAIRPGDLIDFQNNGEEFRALVTEIRSYNSVQEYLQDVTVEKALPGIASIEEAIQIYHQWSTKEELASGFLGIFVQPLKPI